MDLTVAIIKLFVQVIVMEANFAAGRATDAEFDAVWATIPAHRVDDYQDFSASIEIDRVGKDFRATLRGHGGAAAIGWGTPEKGPRPPPPPTVDSNSDQNGPPIP